MFKAFPIFGLTYPMPKVVHIHSWRLGLLRYCVLLSIFLFVFVNQILYKGNHLRTDSLTGMSHISFHSPTVGNCDSFLGTCDTDFNSLDRLDYCKQSSRVGTGQKTCVYRDPTELGAVSGQQDSVLLPTNIRTYVQKRRCFPDASNGFYCPDGIFEYLSPDEEVQASGQAAQPWSDLFVADVERYRILLDHSAISDRGIDAESFELYGSWKNCSHKGFLSRCTLEPILCIGVKGCANHKERQEESLELLKLAAPLSSKKAISKVLNETAYKVMDATKARERPGQVRPKRHSLASRSLGFQFLEETIPSIDDPDAFTHLSEQDEAEYVRDAMENNLAVSVQRGDIFPVSLLLKMAGVNLDAMPGGQNTSEGYRATGFSLVLRVHYSNNKPWVGMDVLPWTHSGDTSLHYTVQALKRSGETLSRRVVQENHKDFVSGRLLGTRVVEEDRGISIVVQQFGDIKVWDLTHMLVILTTSLTMLVVANSVMDMIALNCMENSREYKDLKYQSSESPSHSNSEELEDSK
ncbi:unnamed protein product [Polarella glacialis]|uniref:Uncharacterized protein n=1 Tax=Polarella glacialis TaxID=89957 RepID=A0A813GXV2_POLGL|nr:unnamed protein product [Polarella glacialis]